MRFNRFLIPILLPLLWAGFGARAYPNYISYGYSACLNCHYNPLGNGPLTDYGRSVAATEITDRLFWGSKLGNDEEKLADLSGFFFGKPPNTWLRPSASYRELYYETSPGKVSQKSQFVVMDASAALVLKFLSNDRLTFVGQIGYAPVPLEAQGDGKNYVEYRSREYYMGYRFSKTFGMYAGLMNKAFGLQVPDHIAFSRTVTDMTEDDQTDGILLHYLSGSFEMAVQPFIGNFVQEPSLRQKGATVQVGVMTAETTRLGASFAKSASDFLAMTMYSVDARSGFGKGNSLLFEVGQVQTQPQGGAKNIDRYIFLQSQWLVRKGLYPILTAEMLQPNIYQSDQTFRFGPGIQYFPIYRVELRADLYDTRIRSAAGYSDDTWVVTGQAHLWF